VRLAKPINWLNELQPFEQKAAHGNEVATTGGHVSG